MRKYQAPTKEFFRLSNNIFNLGLTPIQFMLYAYLVAVPEAKAIAGPARIPSAQRLALARLLSRII